MGAARAAVQAACHASEQNSTPEVVARSAMGAAAAQAAWQTATAQPRGCGGGQIGFHGNGNASRTREECRPPRQKDLSCVCVCESGSTLSFHFIRDRWRIHRPHGALPPAAVTEVGLVAMVTLEVARQDAPEAVKTQVFTLLVSLF